VGFERGHYVEDVVAGVLERLDPADVVLHTNIFT
jgi:hypothetical protein